jgi:hypothetical protein
MESRAARVRPIFKIMIVKYLTHQLNDIARAPAGEERMFVPPQNWHTKH